MVYLVGASLKQLENEGNYYYKKTLLTWNACLMVQGLPYPQYFTIINFVLFKYVMISIDD